MKQSNTYIFLYASAMVIIVAAVLSVVSTVLRPYQELNIEIAKKLDILMSVEKAGQLSEASNRTSYIEEEYDRYMAESYVINHLGERQEGVVAFDVNLRDEMRKPLEDRKLPVFVANISEGVSYTILPLHGRGLWGAIFGYIALENDYNTIYGIVLDHDGETPGLGAEINTTNFRQQFKGKKLFDNNNNFVSVQVIKSGTAPPGNHNVDGISGGTITSKGVEDMLKDVLSGYTGYFKNIKSGSNE